MHSQEYDSTLPKTLCVCVSSDGIGRYIWRAFSGLYRAVKWLCARDECERQVFSGSHTHTHTGNKRNYLCVPRCLATPHQTSEPIHSTPVGLCALRRRQKKSLSPPFSPLIFSALVPQQFSAHTFYLFVILSTLVQLDRQRGISKIINLWAVCTD